MQERNVSRILPGEILFIISALLLVFSLLLGAVLILPEVQAARAFEAKVQPPGLSPAQSLAWNLPATWTPGPGSGNEPTPTVTARVAPRLSWPTAPAWDTPIVPKTSLADQLDFYPSVIGQSAGGRALEVYRFGNGPFQRMVIAGIHGGYEWNTIQLADELIAYLKSSPNFVPAHITLFVLRSLNPDGEAAGRGRVGHNNANGVDLNRNWDASWRSDWLRYGCFLGPVSAGQRPASEPETQALMLFLSQQRLDALVSYHSAGPGIYASGDPPHAESRRLAEFLSEASGYPYPGPDTGCIYTGTLVDWAYQTLSIAAVDVELPDHRSTDFQTNLLLLRALLDWIP